MATDVGNNGNDGLGGAAGDSQMLVANRSVLAALGHAGVAVLYQDMSMRYLWAKNPRAYWYADSIEGRGDDDILPPDIAGRVIEAKTRSIADRNPVRHDIELPADDGVHAFELWFDPDLDTRGDVVGLVTTIREATEQRRREQTLRALLLEVSHRSKNLLAIIQSIANQTGRSTETIDDFLDRFRGRLHSLSSSQDLVTSSNWRGADLAQLAMSQIGRYSADPRKNISMSGENPYLNPNAALHVGLALHELAVNSVSFGALSQPDGQIEITATPSNDGSILLQWTEAASFVELPHGQRFSRLALERIVPASLGSTATLEFDQGRIFYRLTLPPDSYSPHVRT